MRNLLTKNAIFDFSNEGGTSQVALIDNWEHLKTNLTYQQNARKEECYIYKLIPHLAEAYDINPSMFDLSLPEPSEENLNNKIWGRVIEILFSNSPIEYLSGDTVL
ncbi:hypothetical protein G6F29_009524 [Rhizopus arrhizus]|nr:hypothetical protein G6F30_009232 [Rhizopus arrhizus]KAG0978166.1 hypothetical protein G6F29_009524 [Rhizopus arrhizus]KAG1092513.1 hypothetical protein G6F39_009275 [Rhizopus arrhizus]